MYYILHFSFFYKIYSYDKNIIRVSFYEISKLVVFVSYHTHIFMFLLCISKYTQTPTSTLYTFNSAMLSIVLLFFAFCFDGLEPRIDGDLSLLTNFFILMSFLIFLAKLELA